MRRIVLVIYFFSQSLVSLAQTWEVGVSAGASGYMGDISPIKPYLFTDPAIGGLFKRNFNGYLSAKVALMHGKIRGDDGASSNANQVDRNLYFRSDINEASLQLEWNIFKFLPGTIPGFGSRRFSPYLFTGVGVFTYNPVSELDGDVIELRPEENEGEAYKKYDFSIAYGAGVKYNLKGNWNVIGELGYRTTFTDYLDDVSGTYPADVGAKRLSDRSLTGGKAPGLQRGDGRPRDTYMFTAISLTYTFVSIKCPTF